MEYWLFMHGAMKSAGGWGKKMGTRNEEVYVLVGDGSINLIGWAQEIITSLQEGYKSTSFCFDKNHWPSRASAASRPKTEATRGGLGTERYRYRPRREIYDGTLAGLISRPTAFFFFCFCEPGGLWGKFVFANCKET